MNLVDSSGWLEYLADSPNAEEFGAVIRDVDRLIVPVICIYEVVKRVYQQRGLEAAQTAAADMNSGQLVEIDGSLPISAALISSDLKLPMADSLILAVARNYRATLWTQDEHFRGLEGIRYIPKR